MTNESNCFTFIVAFLFFALRRWPSLPSSDSLMSPRFPTQQSQSLACHMHTPSLRKHKFFLPALMLTQRGVPIPPRESRMQPCLFFELVNVFSKIPSFASRTSLLSFSLFMGLVLIFYSVGTKRLSFLFLDTRMT